MENTSDLWADSDLCFEERFPVIRFRRTKRCVLLGTTQELLDFLGAEQRFCIVQLSYANLGGDPMRVQSAPALKNTVESR